MGKKSRRVRNAPNWTEPSRPMPEQGQKYATISVGNNVRQAPQSHRAAVGKDILDSLSTTDKILSKWFIQQHVPDAQFGRANPFFHRVMAATWCEHKPVRPTTRHVDAKRIPTYGAFDSGGFVRHVDGDTTNNASVNLCWVSLEDAMINFENWTTDYDILLEPEELLLVADPAWRRGLIFG